MEKDITVLELIKKYNELSNENTKSAFLKSAVKTLKHMTTPVVDVLATQIVNNSSFDDDGNLNIDSFRRYILYIITLIEEYTNIKMDSENAINEYDNLVENDLVDRIISLIPEKCVETLQTAVKIKSDDLIINYQMKRYDKISMFPEQFIHTISLLVDSYTEFLTEQYQDNEFDDENIEDNVGEFVKTEDSEDE